MGTRFMFAVSCTLLSAVAFVSSENCPKGWHFYNQRKRCFLLDSEPLPWEQARDKCKSHGGDLTVIPDNETNAFIKGLIEPSCAEYWIGLHDRPSEGVFQWLDQAGETNFSYWAPNEPNNFGDEDCVVITAAKESQWNDAKCTAYLGFSCEIEAENRSSCTRPQHKNLGCHTKEPEKLTSTTLEPEIISSPTTETDSSSPVGDCPPGWTLYPPRGRCFLHFCQMDTWDGSRKFCKGHGADLAVIPDLVTQKFLQDDYGGSLDLGYMIGLRSKQPENYFRWLDEETRANFTNWATDEPSSYNACVYIIEIIPNVKRTWNTFQCNDTHYFMCEREAENRNFHKKTNHHSIKGHVAQTSPPPKLKTNSRKCPPGWQYYHQRERCFLYVCRENTWNQSREHCKGAGADLVVIPDIETSIFIKGEIFQRSFREFFIGLRFNQAEKYYQWLDEETRANWTEKIDNVFRFEDDRCDCVSVDMQQWQCTSCTYNFPSICERPAEPSF